MIAKFLELHCLLAEHRLMVLLYFGPVDNAFSFGQIIYCGRLLCALTCIVERY